MRFLLVFILSILFLSSCNNDNESKTQSRSKDSVKQLFTKVDHNQSGLNFINKLTDDPFSPFNVLSFDYFNNGGGVAIGDLNNDGLQDVVMTANQGQDKIFFNKGNLKFEDVSLQSNLQKYIGWSTGVTIADVNNDGWQDIYICRAGPIGTYEARRNLLFINNKNGSFSELAKQYGLDDYKLGTQAAFFDYDKDGMLDCYVMNESVYVRGNLLKIKEEMKNESKLRLASGTLYKGQGNKFIDVSKEAKILKYGFGLGLAISDFNDDSWPDIYVANDYSAPDMMWINQKDGTFKDEIKERTDHTSWFSMGIDVSDINNDGHLDIGVVDMASPDHINSKTLMPAMSSSFFNILIDEFNFQRQHMFNVLQVNHGNGNYSNVAGVTGVQKTEWSWSSLFADFDNDGDKDYHVTNGYRKCANDNDFRARIEGIKTKYGTNVPRELMQSTFETIPVYKSKNLLFENLGGLKFKSNADKWGLGDHSFSNGAAYADLDNDGDLDLIVNNIDEQAFLYENNSTNNYIRFKLSSNSISYGTRVTIICNGEKQIQEFYPVKGFQSKMEDIIHFGIGNKESVDKMIVLWPDGKKEIKENLKANKVYLLRNAKAKNENVTAQTNALLTKSKELPFKHVENYFNDFEKEILVPYKQSTLGPFISTADVNKDGLDDFYIGGAKGQAGALFLQKQNNEWVKTSTSAFQSDKNCEDMKSCFFDVDKDGDLDLYVVSGGNEFAAKDAYLKDRLYLNDGKGGFTKSKFVGAPLISMDVASTDLDKDGYQDIFVSGRHQAQKYPFAEKSKIYKNENGVLKDVTAEHDENISNGGLINNALWMDFDNDGDEDLVTSGEWTAINVFENKDGKLVKQEAFEDNYLGWWFSLKAMDIDKDGDMDLIAGNLGTNSKFSASKKKPFKVYAKDFDENGTCDVVLAKEYKGELVPVRGRECSSEQMPFIADKFKTFKEFAHANIDDILGADNLNTALQLEANTFESCIFINENGSFKRKELPIEVQTFPVFGIENIDLNGDGFEDLVLSGNIYGMEIETPRLDAGKGLVLLNNQDGSFKSLPASESGLFIKGDLRDVKKIKTGGGEDILLFSQNDGKLVSYTIN